MALTSFVSHTQFARESGIYNVKADGAVGDGSTDDTVAIQTTLNRFTNGVGATGSGHIYFPQGTYKITAPLIYGGGVSYGLHLEGGIGGTRGPTGTRIDWYGASGGTMFIANGANGCLFENLELNGRGIAKYGIHFAATNHVNTTLGTVVTPGTVEVTPGAMTNIAVGTLLNIDAGASLEYVYVTAVTGTTFTATFAKSHGTSAVVGNGAPSSGNVLKRLTMGGCVGAGSACLAFGNVTSGSTMQVSEVDMYDLSLQGDSSTSVAGIVTLGGGNVKNYKLHGGSIAYFQYGVDWLNASGTFFVSGVILGGQTTADFRLGTGAMTLIGVESETDDCLFVTGTTGANSGTLTIIGCSWQAGCGADDVMIRYSGNITLIGNEFHNRRTGSSVPKIEASLLLADGTPSTLFSQGNFFLYATAGFIPVVDSGGTSVWGAAKGLLSITSLGDYGGDGGALVKLTNFLPVAVQAHQVIATANLPAAATAENGRIVIEDNGAGDRNLVVYAGGQRFRIDGGAAF